MTMGTPMLAVQRPGLPPGAAFQRFPMPPQGLFRPPQPSFDPMKPAMPGPNRPPFDGLQESKEKPPLPGQEWQQKTEFDTSENMDLDVRDSKPEKKSRFSDATPPDSFSQGGPQIGQGMGMLGQMRPQMGPGMSPSGGMRGPRPLMDAGGPNMGPRGPPDGQRFNSPNMMGGPQRGGFGGPGGPPGFRGNRPFQRFPGQFMRPGFRGPPGDMMRPPFEGPGADEGMEMDNPPDEHESDHKRRNSGDRWRDDRDDEGGDYRDYRRDDWRGGRGRGRGRDFGGRGGRRDFDRRDRNRDDRGGRDRDYDRGDRRNRDREDRYRDRNEGFRDRGRAREDRGDRGDHEEREDWRPRTDEERSGSRKEALGWGSALEEMMKTVVIPPPGGKPEESKEDIGPAEPEIAPVCPAGVPLPPEQEEPVGGADNGTEVESAAPALPETPVAPVPPVSDSVKLNGPEVTCDSVPNGEEGHVPPPLPEPETVTEKKEKVPGDLEEGEIE